EEKVAAEPGPAPDDEGPERDLSKVRPVTRGLIQAIALDVQPTPASSMDFGIKTQEHYEAIYYPARNDEITFAQLDAAYGNGPKLTELVNASPSNPHKGIVFETPWDHILPREEAGRPAMKSVLGYDLAPASETNQGKVSLDDLRANQPEPSPSPEQGRGRGR